MSSPIIIAIIAAGGVVVGSFISLIGTFLSHWMSLRKERLRLETERERWIREKMAEVYRNCLSSLSNLLLQRTAFEKLKQPNKSESQQLRETLPIYQETLKWLNALLIYYPDKQKAEFEAFNRQVSVFNVYTGDNDIKALRDSVVTLASDDFRFQLQLPKSLEDIKRGKLKE